MVPWKSEASCLPGSEGRRRSRREPATQARAPWCRGSRSSASRCTLGARTTSLRTTTASSRAAPARERATRATGLRWPSLTTKCCQRSERAGSERCCSCGSAGRASYMLSKCSSRRTCAGLGTRAALFPSQLRCRRSNTLSWSPSTSPSRTRTTSISCLSLWAAATSTHTSRGRPSQRSGPRYISLKSRWRLRTCTRTTSSTATLSRRTFWSRTTATSNSPISGSQKNCTRTQRGATAVPASPETATPAPMPLATAAATPMATAAAATPVAQAWLLAAV
mmetsp:Transcript_8783/g.23072  ORF Transcript_8783/g.23072 Transcript_8783/m.23072 type:complete len:279 (-) Transcript_8783:2714-3550(-)